MEIFFPFIPQKRPDTFSRKANIEDNEEYVEAENEWKKAAKESSQFAVSILKVCLYYLSCVWSMGINWYLNLRLLKFDFTVIVYLIIDQMVSKVWIISQYEWVILLLITIPINYKSLIQNLKQFCCYFQVVNNL